MAEIGITEFTVGYAFLYEKTQRLGLPAFIAPTSIRDTLTGQTITVAVHELFTIIRIDGRDYYFRRLSGNYGNTGVGCSCSNPLADYTQD